jgi:hypothetical protein
MAHSILYKQETGDCLLTWPGLLLHLVTHFVTGVLQTPVNNRNNIKMQYRRTIRTAPIHLREVGFFNVFSV